MALTAGQVQFQYLYQVAPIILLGGIASQLPGGGQSIFSTLQASLQGSILSQGVGNSLDAYVQFIPGAGATLIDNDIGEYPFANQATAANAIITKSLVISYRMIFPATVANGGYAAKQAAMTSLQQTLFQHNLLGGLYACATPSFLWDSCVMRMMRDVSPPVSLQETQVQVEWELDFEQPLVTQAQAQQQYNTLLSKINSGTSITPGGDGIISNSGQQASAGNPGSGQSQSVSLPAQSPGLSSVGSTLSAANPPDNISEGGFGSLGTP